MNNIELKKYYPAGGVVKEDLIITNVISKKEGVLNGEALFSGKSETERVVIYHLVLADGREEYRAVLAKCPHQGADITNDPLKADGNVYCSLHRRPICIYSEYNQAYKVDFEQGHYIIKATTE